MYSEKEKEQNLEHSPRIQPIHSNGPVRVLSTLESCRNGYERWKSRSEPHMEETRTLCQTLIEETKPIVAAWVADRDDFGKTLAFVQQFSKNLQALHKPLDICRFHAERFQAEIDWLKDMGNSCCCWFFCSPERTLANEIRREINKINQFIRDTLSQLNPKNTCMDLLSDTSFVVSGVAYHETLTQNRSGQEISRTYEIQFSDSTKISWHSLEEDAVADVEKRFTEKVLHLQEAHVCAPAMIAPERINTSR